MQTLMGTDLMLFLSIYSETTDHGPVYMHLGAGPTLAAVRQLVEDRVGLKGEAVRIEKLRYTGKKGKTSQGCPIPKWIIRRSSISEKVLVLARLREGHSCEAAWIIIGLLVWEGVSRPLADRVYSTLADKLSKFGIPNTRSCELNKERTCACQGTDEATSGASYTFGCSWAMYNTGCKFSRRGYNVARKFKLSNETEEEGIEDVYQTLATDLAPLYARLAPESYRNQVEFEDNGLECRLGRKPGRPWSSVTTCIDFCAHAHKDINNMKHGCTAVVSLTKNRTLTKSDDEQFHVLPLYALEDTDEAGSINGQAKKVRNGSLEVLFKYPRHHRYRYQPVKSNSDRFFKKPDAAAKQEPPSSMQATTNVTMPIKPKIRIPFMGSYRSHRYPQRPLDIKSPEAFWHCDQPLQSSNEYVLHIVEEKGLMVPSEQLSFEFVAACKPETMPSTSLAISDIRSPPEGWSVSSLKPPHFTRVRRPLPTGWSNRFINSPQQLSTGQICNLQNANEVDIKSLDAKPKWDRQDIGHLNSTRDLSISSTTAAFCGEQRSEAMSDKPQSIGNAFFLSSAKHAEERHQMSAWRKPYKFARWRRPLPTGWSNRFSNSHQLALPRGQICNLQNANEVGRESLDSKPRRERKDMHLLDLTHDLSNSIPTDALCGKQVPEAMKEEPHSGSTKFLVTSAKCAKHRNLRSAKQLYGSIRAPSKLADSDISTGTPVKISVLPGNSGLIAEAPVVLQTDDGATLMPSPKSVKIETRSHQPKNRRIVPKFSSTYQGSFCSGIPINDAQDTGSSNMPYSVQRANFLQESCSPCIPESFDLPAAPLPGNVSAFPIASALQQVPSNSLLNTSSTSNRMQEVSAGAMLETVLLNVQQETALCALRQDSSRLHKSRKVKSPARPSGESQRESRSSSVTRQSMSVLKSILCSRSKCRSQSHKLPNSPPSTAIVANPLAMSSTLCVKTKEHNVAEQASHVVQQSNQQGKPQLNPSDSDFVTAKSDPANAAKGSNAQTEPPAEVVENLQDACGFYEVFDDNTAAFRDTDMGGVAIALGHGSVLFECARCEMHATTALREPNRLDPKRISLVFYQHRNLNSRHHGAAEWEQRQEAKKGPCGSRAECKVAVEEAKPNEHEVPVADVPGMLELEEGFVYLDGYESGPNLFVVPINPL